MLHQPGPECQRQLALKVPYGRVCESGWDGDGEPLSHAAGEGGDVPPHDVLHHGALEAGHVDGQEGAEDQDQGVEGQEARLAACPVREHDPIFIIYQIQILLTSIWENEILLIFLRAGLSPKFSSLSRAESQIFESEPSRVQKIRVRVESEPNFFPNLSKKDFMRKRKIK